MNSNQEAKLNMYDAVIAHCDANNLIVATIPALATTLTDFKTKVTAIHSTAINEVSAISGVAVDKADMKEEVAKTALNIAGAVFALASGAGNNELKEKVNFSRTDLLRLKDELFTAAVQDIHNQANANIGALVSYGVTAPVLASFQAEITNYANKVPAPRNAASLRSSYGDQLKQLFTDCDEMLKEQMDKLALQLSAAEPVFYNAYKSNRVIIDPISATTKVTGTIKAAANDLPVSGANITVTGKAYTDVSAADGSYTLVIPIPGVYEINVAKAGFITQQQNVTVVLGQTTNLDIDLGV